MSSQVFPLHRMGRSSCFWSSTYASFVRLYVGLRFHEYESASYIGRSSRLASNNSTASTSAREAGRMRSNRKHLCPTRGMYVNASENLICRSMRSETLSPCNIATLAHVALGAPQQIVPATDTQCLRTDPVELVLQQIRCQHLRSQRRHAPSSKSHPLGRPQLNM